MTINFDMTGKLVPVKDTEKFKGYEEVKYNSGWINRTLNFNVISGNNRFMLRTRGGKFEDEHNDIYVFSKGGLDENGKQIKGEGFRIPFKERLIHKRLPEVVEWKKFIVDLEEPGHRWKIQNAIEKLEDGHDFSEDELDEFGVKSADELKDVLEKSNKKRKEFISEWDYAEYLHKVLTSEKYKDRMFNIKGEYVMEYSEAKNQWYSHYAPTRIYLAAKDAEPVATATVTLFYDESGLDDGVVEEKNKYYLNGYVQVYDSNKKKNVFAPYTVAIPVEDNKKKMKKIVEILSVDDGVKELGMIVDLIDGSEMKEIEMEDLDLETQDLILCGLVDFEDVKHQMGGNVYGSRVTENRFKKFSRNYSTGAKETVYTSDDLHNVSAEDDSDDLFGDDDDLFA